MVKKNAPSPPPDRKQREIALDPNRSILVQAPAGSGKTDLLTRRFLRLLAEVEEPGQIVAITFTKAAAAEMRNRILSKLEDAAAQTDLGAEPGSASVEALANRALAHSHRLGWNLLDQPAQLRISTIDSFCREIALQQPLLSGLGGGMEISESPRELYRRAARRTLQQIGGNDMLLSGAIRALLLRRDNHWQELEELLVSMLEQRDRWMHDFVFDREMDWKLLREQLERPFRRISADARYTDEEWQIVRNSFLLLRHATAELKVIFAETGTADFIEIAQIAEAALRGEEEHTTEGAMAFADGIRHLLVDEFQDTSRRQYQMLSRLIAAWPEREGRTCFVVGDPMQSIYFFRGADAELFPRVRDYGFTVPGDQPLRLETVQLSANFRTAPALVEQLNDAFQKVFAADDGSGIRFEKAEPARKESHCCWTESSEPRNFLHLEFVPQTTKGRSSQPKEQLKGESKDFQIDLKKQVKQEQKEAQSEQIAEIVELIRGHSDRVSEARARDEKYRIAVLGRTHNSLDPVAGELRNAAIPFRAVGLEALKNRPEVLDALALARALLNPQDRVAWLGLLRAPWCGLSLADLHMLTSADEKALVERPVLELLAARAELLSTEGCLAVRRVMDALADAPRLRFTRPELSLGAWIEQVWLRLGGGACVDAAARANVDLLWRCLDGLPEAEQDLLGPALDAALDKLKALPDPLAESDYGVQLMTIHAAKGLEFEVVIVPDLQAGVRPPEQKLLSWLERGLAKPDASNRTDRPEEVTEFLIAPIQPKGADRGEAKQFVDGAYKDRERQEMRRLLYVAATRAREELHLFARQEYKVGKDGRMEPAAPRESLLKTAWPALEEEILSRFAQWRAGIAQEKGTAEENGGTLEAIAASSDENLLVMPTPKENTQPKPTTIRRLPADFDPERNEGLLRAEQAVSGQSRLYERHEGGLHSRALGTAVHALLDELARLCANDDWEAANASLARFEPRISAQVRSAGLDSSQAARVAAQAFAIVRQAAEDPLAQWILSPHPEAASEQRWTGVLEGALRTVQVDRVFRAAASPLAGGDAFWWVIDYKTAHAEGLDPAAALPELRKAFSPQVEAYAHLLRKLHGAGAPLRAGLYYPRMMQFDWWEIK